MKDFQFKTTIVIPTYNRNKLLKQVLPSYQSQEYVEEILIIDDGSKVKVSQYLNEEKINVKKVRVIRHFRSLGLCAARNSGILNAKTPWIFFGEDDLLLSKHHLSILHDYRISLKADMVCAKVLIQQNDESLIEAEKINRENIAKKRMNVFDFKYIHVNTVAITKPIEVPCGNAIFLAKTTLLKKHLFNTRLGGPSFAGEDIEIQLFLRKLGYKMYAIPYATSLHLNRSKSFGSGTRLNDSSLVFTLSFVINIYQIINEYYDILKPFFKISKKRMIKRAIFWNFVLQIKRFLESKYKFIKIFLEMYRKFFN